MDITKRLTELNADLVLHNEGKWDKTLDKNDSGYTSFNDAGVETEVGEFLYALTRILKPKHILETGTHWGVGAAYMGHGLKDNKMGLLETLEFDANNFAKAKKNIQALDLNYHVQLYLADATNFTPRYKYELMLLDTEPQTRFTELVRFERYLEPGGFVFIHDLHRHMHQIPNEEHGFAWPFGPLPYEILKLVNKDQLRPMHFPTPRGLTGFYKPHEDDYKWINE